MVARSRWTKRRLALAAYHCGRGETESGIADHAEIGSRIFAVREQLRAIGLVARPDSGLEHLIAIPAAIMPTIAAVARARGRRERAEDLLAKVIVALAEEPTIIANVLDDADDPGFDGRIRDELGKLADGQVRDAFRMDRSARYQRKRRGSANGEPTMAFLPKGQAQMLDVPQPDAMNV